MWFKIAGDKSYILSITVFLIMISEHLLQGSSSQGASTRSQAGPNENNSVTIGVADEHIGAVVGRGGRNIMEITQVCLIMPFSFILRFRVTSFWPSLA